MRGWGRGGWEVCIVSSRSVCCLLIHSAVSEAYNSKIFISKNYKPLTVSNDSIGGRANV